MSTALKIEGLGKEYRIKKAQTTGSKLTRLLRSPWDNFRVLQGRGTHMESFWALKDVSFSVPTGDILGIIGRNGAGKSTLLKILTGITVPTEGRIQAAGRVASLLEVGTGFHPDLTGRENIFLNGAILGMSKQDIKQRFDEIVAFSDAEKFLETPVKRYSSGMYVRLAFAVAAHLDPDILLVDEVLAVGDANFQKKCLAKMNDIGSSGRTVLFVSHSMPTVLRLCPKLLLLQDGQVVEQGDAQHVVTQYMDSAGRSPASMQWDETKRPGDEFVRLNAVSVRDQTGSTCSAFDVADEIRVQIDYELLDTARPMTPIVYLFNSEGLCAFSALAPLQLAESVNQVGTYSAEVLIPSEHLNEGRYYATIALRAVQGNGMSHVYEHEAVSFQTSDNHENTSTRAGYVGDIPGVVRPRFDWQIQPQTNPYS